MLPKGGVKTSILDENGSYNYNNYIADTYYVPSTI